MKGRTVFGYLFMFVIILFHSKVLGIHSENFCISHGLRNPIRKP